MDRRTPLTDLAAALAALVAVPGLVLAYVCLQVLGTEDSMMLFFLDLLALVGLGVGVALAGWALYAAYALVVRRQGSRLAAAPLALSTLIFGGLLLDTSRWGWLALAHGLALGTLLFLPAVGADAGELVTLPSIPGPPVWQTPAPEPQADPSPWSSSGSAWGSLPGPAGAAPAATRSVPTVDEMVRQSSQPAAITLHDLMLPGTAARPPEPAAPPAAASEAADPFATGPPVAYQEPWWKLWRESELTTPEFAVTTLGAVFVVGALVAVGTGSKFFSMLAFGAATLALTWVENRLRSRRRH